MLNRGDEGGGTRHGELVEPDPRRGSRLTERIHRSRKSERLIALLFEVTGPTQPSMCRGRLTRIAEPDLLHSLLYVAFMAHETVPSAQ
jgi:hypothetical protein